MNKIYDLNPDLLAQLYHQQRWDELWRYVISLLEKLYGSRADKALRKVIEEDYEDSDSRAGVVEFCKILSEFLVVFLNDDKCAINDDIFFDLLEFHEAIHAVFYIAGYADTDALVSKITMTDQRLDAEKQKKLLLLLRLDTNLELLDIISSTMRKLHIPLIMAFLSYTRMDGAVHDRKIALLALGEKVGDLAPHRNVFKLVSKAFFYVSFLHYADKHKIKKSINRYVEAFIKKYVVHDKKRLKEAKRIGESRRNSEVREKPLLLFYPEFFKKNHAMYRSWARRIEGLKSDFDVHILIQKDEYSQEMKEDYPNIHICDSQRMNEAIYQIYKLAPDVLFFPSVGMTSPGMIFSNMRFCDVQVMGLGHPATSMSRHIDYVIGHSEYYDEKSFAQECFVKDNMPPVFQPRQELAGLKFNAPNNHAPKDRVELSVVGTHFKLSGPFLDTLKQLVDEADFKIHVTFLVSGIGLSHVFLTNILGEMFPDCTVKGFQEYSDYLNDLSNTDIMVSPFPFGHSNTVFDALLMGKPCVCLHGDEPHSRTESVILKHVHLDHQFVVHSLDEYKSRFGEICKEILDGERNFFDPADVYKKLCEDAIEYDYASVFKYILDRHKSIKADRLKVVDVNE